MRRHSPRTSPSCTCVSGPTDPTRREFRLGAARTVAQDLATALLHPAARRGGGLRATVLPGGAETVGFGLTSVTAVRGGAAGATGATKGALSTTGVAAPLVVLSPGSVDGEIGCGFSTGAPAKGRIPAPASVTAMRDARGRSTGRFSRCHRQRLLGLANDDGGWLARCRTGAVGRNRAWSWCLAIVPRQECCCRHPHEQECADAFPDVGADVDLLRLRPAPP